MGGPNNKVMILRIGCERRVASCCSNTRGRPPPPVAEWMRRDGLREEGRPIIETGLGADVAAPAQPERQGYRRRLLEHDVLRAELDVVERVAAVERELQIGAYGVRQADPDVRA